MDVKSHPRRCNVKRSVREWGRGSCQKSPEARRKYICDGWMAPRKMMWLDDDGAVEFLQEPQ